MSWNAKKWRSGMLSTCRGKKNSEYNNRVVSTPTPAASYKTVMNQLASSRRRRCKKKERQ